MERFFRYSLTLLIILVAGSQFIQVVTRYLLEIPVMGLEEATLIPTLWLYMLGSVNASREDTQIRANVLDIFLKKDRAKALLQAFADTISVVVSIWLATWAWDYFSYASRVGKSTPTLYIPTIIYESALMVGLSLMIIFTLWHLLRNIAYLFGIRQAPDHSGTDPDYPETTEVQEFKVLTDNKKGRKND
ncbi:TRAP transporter small permease subunit [Halomonas sp. MCCC 1A17488]|uniref:TRAP transporter small permease n=1 Tax=unclassified Halomonas TaxID=2609666 RepID=UPI0018D2384B|nr:MULTISPECIES: TRAP transporter small permease subunit [unclassified Halomonas]MCE8015789.1 TRAP transporter small permease subunit [Halomonas sp. MCCC 1A17488]MCG3239122.1 TRAP transporter small permease subunit [Halomonas sp. MCCC 1A17488]QPP50935.1 TRAP transporter small permease subunit [Halomonas sp. SS10-MC5]